MTRVNPALLVLLLGAVAANFLVRHDPKEPNSEFLPEMVHSTAYDAYAPNPNFADGKTLQAPVAGTIARGFRRPVFGPSPEDAVRAGEELKNPLDGPDPKERGAFVYQTFCLPCHGATGNGDGPVVLRGYPAPPNLRAEKTVSLKDGRMFHILTFGQKNMPGYASQLSEEDRWRVIAYVRTMQRSKTP